MSPLQKTRFLEFFPKITLYNSHLWAPEVVSEIFYAHLPELRASFHDIQTSAPDKASSHLMILGSRGMGKSTFLRNLLMELRKDPEISASWLTLDFPEEQYTVSTLAEFWCAVLRSLQECLEQTDPGSSELADLKKLLAGMDALGTKRKEEEAFSFLREIRRRRGQGMIFCVDNTDLLLKGIACGDPPGERNSSSSAVWRLRRTLDREKGLFWIGSTSRSLEEYPEISEVFRDFFSYRKLLPIDPDTMKKIMLSFTEHCGMGLVGSGEKEVKAMKQMIHGSPERLKIIHILTGGDPRSVLILCNIFAGSSKGDAKSDLACLLDQMTPFYKARLESLSEQPRKIVAHLMEAWHPLSAKQLAQIADLPVTTISGQLSRLEIWNFVEKAGLSDSKRNNFQISERLFNAWYLMRHPFCEMHDSFYWLLEFMQLWFSNEVKYSPSQLQSSSRTSGEYPDLSEEFPENPVNQSLLQKEPGKACPDWRLPLFKKKIQQKLQVFLPHLPKDSPSSRMESWQDRLGKLDDLLGTCPQVQANPAQKKAWILDVKGSPSLELYEKELIADQSPELTDFQFNGIRQILEEERNFLEIQLGYRGILTLQEAVLNGRIFPDFPNAQTLHRQIHSLFQKEEAAFVYALTFLYQKKDGKAYFIKGLENAMASNSQNAHFWNFAGNLWQHYFDNPQKAKEAYQKAITLAPGLASAWNHLGTVLQYRLKQSGEAEKAYTQAIALDAKFSWPWVNLGNLSQYRSRNFKKAEEAYKKALALDPGNGLAWNNLGNLLHYRMKDFEGAESAYRNALASDEKKGIFWNNLGNLLRFCMTNREGAEEAYGKAVALDPQNSVFWGDLADFFAKDLAKYSEAKQAYEKALELDPDNSWLWTDLGDLLGNRLKIYDQAENAYRKAIRLNPDDPFPQMGLGSLFCDHLQEYDKAIKLLEKAIQIDKEDPWGYAKLARVFAKSGDRDRAGKNYLLAETFARSEAWAASPAVKGILLQSAIFFEKNSEAQEILCSIVRISLEEKEFFFRLKEQVWECHSAGLGTKLALLMEENIFSDFLKPFTLALMVKEKGNEALFSGFAPEMTVMAKAVFDDIFGQNTFL